MHSLRKGHLFENQMAKWLVKVTGVQWQRVLSSGGYATIHNLQSFSGDVYSESEQYKDILVECKSYKDPVTLADINNEGSKFNSWIAQTKREAGNRMWLLFFKANHSKTFLLVPTTDALAYATDNTLKPIFTACRGVCQTKEWMLFEVV